MITQTDLDNWFTYHAPTSEDTRKYERIRNTAKVLAEIILENTPPSPDQTAAIRKIREAVMTANAAIACEVDLTIPDDDKGVGRTPRELR